MHHYLNNAGAGLMSQTTFSVVANHMRREMEVGAGLSAQEARPQADAFYSSAARLINANDPGEIAFMDSASRGWNMAIYGSGMGAGDRIITLSSEFGTNLITLFDLAFRVGASVQVIPCDESGRFDVGEVEDLLRRGARMVAISQVAAHGAIVNPVCEIGVLAKRYGALYIVDGCQAVGQIPVDARDIQCDAYVATGRKWLRGPRGTGFLYVRDSARLMHTQLDLGGADLILEGELNVSGVEVRKDARRFELWERSFASMLGLSSAVSQYLELDESVLSRIIELSAEMRRIVAASDSLRMFGEIESESGIVGFYLNDPKREEAVRRMFSEAEVEVSTMSDWDCPLHFPKNGAKTIFRLSPHYYTSDETFDLACRVLRSL